VGDRSAAVPITVSVRMLWPFARLTGGFRGAGPLAAEAGFDLRRLADPDGRMPAILARKILEAAVEETHDPALGLHAGEAIESSDFGVMGMAARSCPDLRRAFACGARYLRLLDDNVQGVMIEDGDRCTWQIRNVVPRPLAIVNDFQVTSAIVTMSRFAGRKEVPLEVHVRHSTPTDAREYARAFGGAPVRFRAPHNAVVYRRALLDEPVWHANPTLLPELELRAQSELEKLAQSLMIKDRLRQLITARIASGDLDIGTFARELRMSSSTLRRRLDEEHTTYREVLDDVRRELALQHLRERRLAVGEIAFLLGFASRSAFARAFRRWAGTAPHVYRARSGSEALI
jgi:AraC-like DNA-binding protein